ncbi:MAG TPA: hypothetical protein DCG63_03775 [Methylophilaceae bacterium]|nr:hypothetical protein [Methylophilaceae bacterium]
MANFGFNTPFKEQLDFFRQKINLPTQRWDDIQKSAHDKAFIVAGAANADMLQDFNIAIEKAIAEGKGIQEFRKDFKKIVKKYGWTGWAGEGSAGGEAWRTRVIYQTNMATSYAAGRWAQLTDPEYLKLNPNWRYVHMDGLAHPRPLHESWNGVTLPHDHIFWKTHFAPNGWGCHCRIVPAGRRESIKQPPHGWNKLDPNTGAPIGIDKGFDYAPGANVKRPLQAFIDDKLIKLDAPIGAAMWQVLKPILQIEQLASYQDMALAVLDAGYQAQNIGALAFVLPEPTVANMATLGQSLETAAVYMVDNALIHAMRDIKLARGATLPNEVWINLPNYLAKADIYFDTQDPALVFALDVDGVSGKVVVRVNYSQKIRFDGKRANLKANFVSTGGIVDADNVVKDSRYVKLEK